MDNHIWSVVYQTIKDVDRAIPRCGRRPVYSDVLIVAMYIWSVWHDRPLCWACDRRHYGGMFRPRRLPSVSQFCKRIKTERCEAIMQKVHEHLSRMEWQTELSFLDGRAMPVGPCSKDRDAARGPTPRRDGKRLPATRLGYAGRADSHLERHLTQREREDDGSGNASREIL